MPENDRLWEKVTAMEIEIGRIVTRLDGHQPTIALVGQLEKSVVRIEQSVASLSEDARNLFAAHDTLLKEKAQAERAELLAKTPLGLVKKYGPVVTFIIGSIAVYRILGAVAEGWLRIHGFQ
jgi:hypothetical protein